LHVQCSLRGDKKEKRTSEGNNQNVGRRGGGREEESEVIKKGTFYSGKKGTIGKIGRPGET